MFKSEQVLSVYMHIRGWGAFECVCLFVPGALLQCCNVARGTDRNQEERKKKRRIWRDTEPEETLVLSSPAESTKTPNKSVVSLIDDEDDEDKGTLGGRWAYLIYC